MNLFHRPHRFRHGLAALATLVLFGSGALTVLARRAGTGLDADLDRNASQWPGTQAEVSIAADPSDPAVVLAAAMNLSDGRILAMSTRDGGETWTRVPVPLGEGSSLDNDPMVAFDSRGAAYLARVPAGSGGTGIDVVRSPDGGRTWEAAVRVAGLDRNDKVALAVDDDARSPYRDRVYVAWKWPRGGVFVSRSLDSGETFSPPQLVEQAVVTGLDLAVGGDGAVYLAFRDGPRHSIRVMRSQDGGETFEPSVEAAPVNTRTDLVPPSHCIRPVIVQASVSVDRSGGPRRGAVYAAWADYPPGVGQCGEVCGAPAVCAPDVYFSRSDDGGLTWSQPAPVDDERGGEVDRYHPWLRVDRSTGTVSVAYKDSRNDPTRAGADVYMRQSNDGGATWDPALRLSSATSRATSLIQCGDYQSVAAEGGYTYAAWADYRESPTQGEIYVRRFAAPFPTVERGDVVRVSRDRPPPRTRP